MQFILLLLLSSFINAFADEITLHFIPAPKPINWSSPNSLLISTLINTFTKTKSRQNSIGHVNVELKCDSINLHHFTGMTSKGSETTMNVLFKKYGMAALFVVNKGQHEVSDVVEKNIEKHNSVGRSSFFTVEVAPESCARAYEYYKEFDALGYGKLYSGLNLRPRYREGSGCSAYGASYLDINNLLIPEIEAAWMTDILVPLKYIGKPLTNNKVGFFKILTDFNSRWAKISEPHMKLHFYDPDKMDEWARNAYEAASHGQKVAGFKMIAETRGESHGVRVDLTSIDTPTTSFWLSRP